MAQPLLSPNQQEEDRKGNMIGNGERDKYYYGSYHISWGAETKEHERNIWQVTNLVKTCKYQSIGNVQAISIIRSIGFSASIVILY